MGKYLIITFLLLPLSLITNIENDFNGVEPLKRNLNSQTIDVFTYDADYFTNIAANEAALTYQVEIEGNLNNSRTDDDYYGFLEHYTYLLIVDSPITNDYNYFVLLNEMSFTPYTYKGGLFNAFNYFTFVEKIGVVWSFITEEGSAEMSATEVGTCDEIIGRISLEFNATYITGAVTYITGDYILPAEELTDTTIYSYKNASTCTQFFSPNFAENDKFNDWNISKYTFYTITVLRTYSDFRGSVKGDTVLDYYHGYGTQKILNGDYIHHTDYYTIEI